ncbi:MAG: type II secretion system GspH family protein [Gammaproteobacteria bacterium]|nr:type II secretion system GspH family protein [Gammaproteobacteria bacterium]
MERLLKNRGFTFIEVLIVIIIASVLAITAFFKWSGSSININSQVELLANDIRYAQNLAMAQHQKFRLAITSSNTYQIQDESDNPVPIATRGTTVTLGPGITFGSTSTITSKIIFDAKGVPYDDNPVIPLTSNAIMRLTGNGETIAVTIYPETGRVTP